MREDLNGRIPKIGDIIHRQSLSSRGFEMVMSFTGNGNPKLARFLDDGVGGYKTYNTGYLTSADYVILDTPNMNDKHLGYINEERKKMGLKPLKRYGDS